MSLYRFQIDLSGWVGAPGMNVLNFRSSQIVIEESLWEVGQLITETYFTFTPFFVTGVSAHVNTEVQKFDEQSGKLEELFQIPSLEAVTGTATGTNTSRATMVVAQFRTDAVVDGRRLGGRSYLGPVGALALNADGSINQGVRDTVTEAYAGLMDVLGVRLAVWHRPTRDAQVPGQPKPPLNNDGAFGHVQAVGCSPLPGVLRSRRDS